MGVIKNLWVRIGVDARGFRKGMKDAANSTMSTSQTVSRQMSSMKKNVAEKFASSRMSIREHAAAISQTKEKYTVAIQNTERLSDKIQELQGVYDMVKSATEGMDLSAPLEEQIKEAKESYYEFLREAQKAKDALSKAFVSKSKKDNTVEVESLRKELNRCRREAEGAKARLEELKQVEATVGRSNLSYASVAGLQQLQSQIVAAENELNTTKIRAEELHSKLKSLGILPTVGSAVREVGSAAAQAARNGVSKLGQKLKSFGGTVLKGIASIPSKLKSIGSSADRSCGGLGRMVRSIRNIGIASLGMRIAGGMFGRLRSIISSYVSQNEELNSSIESMKNQMGEALLPAINLVLAAMQRLMPVVTAVSNGINSVLTSLFGKMSRTTSKIKKAANAANSLNVYGFDQITKSSEANSESSASSASEGKQSALVQKLTGWIQRLKAAFVAGDWKKLGQIVGDGINSAFDAIRAIDVGSKFGSFVNNLVTVAYGILSTVDFNGIGSTLGQMLTSAIERVDWNQTGDVIGLALLAMPSVLVGFALSTDWGKVGQAISQLINSALSTGTKWIQNTDWLKLGENVSKLISNVDWGGLVKNLFEFFGAALGAGVSFLWGSIEGTVTSIKTYFTAKIEAAGGDLGKGLWKGILDGLGDIGKWIKNNVEKPFVAGFRGLGNGVVEVIEDTINSVIGGFKDLFGKIGKVLGSIAPGTSLSDQLPTMQTVTLPRAARGTIVSKATDLTVGEDGTEAVVPLERHTEWLDVVASKLSAKQSGGGTSPTPIVLQFILGNRKLTEYYIKDINQIGKETGVCPIII